MLGAIRKFSSSIFAKIFLFLVAIPFIFWGMGDLFRSGNQNTIVKIGNEKVSSQEFINYINKYAPMEQKINDSIIDKLLNNFIGEKLIQAETKELNIKVTDNSLGQLVKNQKIFEKNNEFSRVEYEKFLLENSLTAVMFESEIQQQERKKQLLNYIGGGIVPSHFTINTNFNKINQKRIVRTINLNNYFDKKFTFSDDEIKSYYEKNKNNYVENFKSLKYLELSPKALTGNDEISDLFFKKLDEIDDIIVEGKNLDFIIESYNLNNPIIQKINREGFLENSTEKSNIPDELVNKFFKFNESEPTILTEYKDKYYAVELISIENIQKKLDNLIRKKIISNLKRAEKRKFISEIITKINADNFRKSNFYNFSSDEKIAVNKITIVNQNDDKNFEKSLINQIYKYPEDKVIIATDMNFTQTFLVYIEKIENVSINKGSSDYKEYSSLSKINMINNLYETYDRYLEKKYDININSQALDSIKNYFK